MLKLQIYCSTHLEESIDENRWSTSAFFYRMKDIDQNKHLGSFVWSVIKNQVLFVLLWAILFNLVYCVYNWEFDQEKCLNAYLELFTKDSEQSRSYGITSFISLILSCIIYGFFNDKKVEKIKKTQISWYSIDSIILGYKNIYLNANLFKKILMFVYLIVVLLINCGVLFLMYSQLSSEKEYGFKDIANILRIIVAPMLLFISLSLHPRWYNEDLNKKYSDKDNPHS